MQHRKLFRVLLGVMGVALAGATFALTAPVASADTSLLGPQPASSPACSACHANPELSMTLAGGDKISLFVNEESTQNSVHGKLECQACHAGYSFPHQPVEAKSLFEYRKLRTNVCQGCHPAVFTDVQSSVHTGLDPIGITCIDCHGSHTIEPAQAVSLRATTLALCTTCHQDQQLMRRYGLSTTVVSTYLKDFHGRTSFLLAKNGQNTFIDEAVCADCHGAHAIVSVHSPKSQVIRANLTATCQKCHDTATPNFPDSWMSHYAPTLTKTPLVFFARLFYWIMIPFTIGGVLIHIIIDLRHHAKVATTEKR
jgi:predicted CXXCH cytochrome family protein